MYPDRSVSTELNDDWILSELSDGACSSSNARRQKCIHPTYSGPIPWGGGAAAGRRGTLGLEPPSPCLGEGEGLPGRTSVLFCKDVKGILT
jgi:hypothetical protein